LLVVGSDHGDEPGTAYGNLAPTRQVRNVTIIGNDATTVPAEPGTLSGSAYSAVPDAPNQSPCREQRSLRLKGSLEFQHCLRMHIPFAPDTP